MSLVEEEVVRAPSGEGWQPSLGAWPEGSGTRFRVWAPRTRVLEVVLERPGRETLVRPLEKGPDGTFGGLVPEAQPGDRYRYRADGQGPFPDPATRFQPDGVHGPSEIVDPRQFRWTDSGWRGPEAEELVLYELHVGTFSPEGTFAGGVERLPLLRDLGVTAIELMPLADFAGSRSWGYDGVDLFAPSRCYGTPDDLRRLVDEAHRIGLAVVLDVVYNHFGPVGNYAMAFSPQYLSDKHSSAWAACVNLDGEGAGMVREFFIENALHWLHEYHLDGLRLDATHALIDESPRHFIAELVARVRESVTERPVSLIAEDHRNWNIMLRPAEEGGWGLDGVWADDFHHEMRRLVAGDNEGYYRDYTGTTADLAITVNRGWFYCGQFSTHLNEPRGTDPSGIPPRQFVICLQNHDQVGNRAMGDRLTETVTLAAYRAASALLLCAPQTPLLFMGQEWAASTPFLYFTDHDEDLGKIVTEGRRREFRHFLAFADPEARERIPDPQAASTFAASRLVWSERQAEPHAATVRLYQTLLHLRRDEPALRSGRLGSFEAAAVDEDTILLRRNADDGPALLVVARLRGSGPVDLTGQPAARAPRGGRWELVLTTEDPPFASEPSPPVVDLAGAIPGLRFEGPAAVVLRSVPHEGDGAHPGTA